MNIEMQLCGLVIVLMILHLYNRHEKVGLYTEKLFRFVLAVTIESLVLDILSVVLIANEKIPRVIVKGECKLYLVSLVMVAYATFAYSSADIARMMRTNKFVRAFGLGASIVCVIILFLPIYIYHEGDVVYTYGPAVYATYASTVFLIVLLLIGVFRQSDVMPPRRRRALITWLVIWVVAAGLQFLNNEWLVVGFASALGVMVLFFELENPESNIDKTTGFFNNNAFTEFMRQNYASSDKNCGMLVSMEDSAAREVKGERLDAALLEISFFLRRVPETKIFRLDEYEFALLFANQENLDRARHMIESRFNEPWLECDRVFAPINLRPYYMIVPSGNVAGSIDELTSMMKYFRSHYRDNSESRTLVMTPEVVARKKAREEMIHTIEDALEEDRVEVFYQPIY